MHHNLWRRESHGEKGLAMPFTITKRYTMHVCASVYSKPQINTCIRQCYQNNDTTKGVGYTPEETTLHCTVEIILILQ